MIGVDKLNAKLLNRKRQNRSVSLMAKHVSDLTPNDLYELGHVYAPHIYALIQQQHILFTTTCDNKTFFFFMSLGRR